MHSRLSLLVGLGCSLCILALAGCSDDHRVVGPRRPLVPNLTLAELQSAPDTLVVDDTTMTARVDLWRDFMGGPPGSGLYVAAQLNGTPPGTYPASAGDVYVWVINGTDVWSSVMRFGMIDPGLSNAHTFQADGGPRWGPGIQVDVVLGVRISATQVALVRLPGRTILMVS